MLTARYGPGPDQAGDLHLPASRGPLVCLFHGGFWRMPYDRTQCTAIAEDLAVRGYAVWNLEYRRVGEGGHPWPATREDVDLILDALPSLGVAYPEADLSRVIFAGHSAGGHLAFWAAARRRRVPRPFRVAGAIGLAPLLDLAAAHAAGLGRGAVEAFLGGPSDTFRDRLVEASPRALLPLGVPQVVLHGEDDTAVPLADSRAYVDAAHHAGDAAALVALRATDHMAFLDPATGAHRALRSVLEDLTGGPPSAGR